MLPARLSVYDTLLQQLPQHLQDMPVELRELIQREHAMGGSDTSLGISTWPPPIRRIRDGLVKSAKRASSDQRRTVPGQAGTLWMRVVSMASARVIAGRMVVSRRASIDLPAPEAPRRRTL